MSALTLISHPLCPFVQRAAIVLLEKNVKFDRINVDLSEKPDWFLAISPTGKVPLLKVRQPESADAILFESMVICEYLNDTQGGAPMYPADALLRAQSRAWIEFATQTFADGWQFLHARDSSTADTKLTAFRDRLGKLETAMSDGPFFSGATFGMVDAAYAPLLRYFGLIDAKITEQVFDGFPRISAWRWALEQRASVKEAVVANYADLFLAHLRQQEALVTAK